MIKELLKEIPTIINAMDNEYRNCLYYTMKQKNYQLYWYLLNQKAEINKLDINGKFKTI